MRLQRATPEVTDELQVQQVPTAANTLQQAFSQAGLPFNHQAAQFAAALAQAQQAPQLVSQQVNTSQHPIQFPAGQVCRSPP